MSSGFLLFFQPTFTQGLIIGQLSILLLLGAVLKYLFLESSKYPPAAYHQQVDNDAFVRQRNFQARQTLPEHDPDAHESTEWFNLLLKQVGLLLGPVSHDMLHLKSISDRRYISVEAAGRCHWYRRGRDCPKAHRVIRELGPPSRLRGASWSSDRVDSSNAAS